MQNKLELSEDVFQYFLQSYKYYVAFEENDITDAQFDILCHRLLKGYEYLTDIEQSLLDKESLAAGTGFDISMETYKQVGIV